jgi:hypothetical protein
VQVVAVVAAMVMLELHLMAAVLAYKAHKVEMELLILVVAVVLLMFQVQEAVTAVAV